MTLSTRSARALVAAASLLLLLAIAGCGMSPTAPLNSAGGQVTTPAGPPVLQVNPDGTAAWVTIPSALQSGTPGPVYDEASFDPTRSLKVMQQVDGAVGGRLVCGRFVASVPAGAFDGVGVITMSLPDSTLMICELEVAPVELNAFRTPVELSLHTTGTTAELDSLEIYWWDPAKSDWTAMGCARSNVEPVLADEFVTLEPIKGATLSLTHFSKYAAGKAGW